MAITCIFCDIAAKKSPAEIVYEDDQVVVFPDIDPNAPIHLLVVPKEHHPDIDTLTDPAVLSHAVDVARQVGAQQSPELGYRIMVNSSGQADIPHLHVHVLGGLQKDESPRPRGGDSNE